MQQSWNVFNNWCRSTRSTIPESALEIIEPIRKAKNFVSYLRGIWNQLIPFTCSICKSTLCKKGQEWVSTGCRNSIMLDLQLRPVKTCDEAIKLYKELSELWGKAGMNQINQVLKEIPDKDRAKKSAWSVVNFLPSKL